MAGINGKTTNSRFSKTRKAILDRLESEHCLSAEQILSSFTSSRTPHKTTVYRLLDGLMSSGIIRELDFGDGRKRYELNNDRHHHHLVCENCKAAIPVYLNEIFGQAQKKAEATGFLITDHLLEFKGVCRNCR